MLDLQVYKLLKKISPRNAYQTVPDRRPLQIILKE